jgi:hypothetical protein
LAIGGNKIIVLEMMVLEMMETMQAGGTQVHSLRKGEVERMMKMGAEIAGMAYNSKATFNKERECAKLEHMTMIYMQSRDANNIQKVHFILHELSGQT